MQVNVRYSQNLQFQAMTRGHAILGDQPIDNGGDNAGMTPPEWFLAAIGSCIGFYIVKYCQTRGLDATGLSVDVSAQKVTDGAARLDDFQIQVNVPITLEPRHQQGIKRAAEACLIHNTLRHLPTMTLQINSLGEVTC